jgi:hypothetical protein
MADDERLYRETGITVCRLGPSTDEQARLLIVFLLFIAFTFTGGITISDWRQFQALKPSSLDMFSFCIEEII